MRSSFHEFGAETKFASDRNLPTGISHVQFYDVTSWTYVKDDPTPYDMLASFPGSPSPRRKVEKEWESLVPIRT